MFKRSKSCINTVNKSATVAKFQSNNYSLIVPSDMLHPSKTDEECRFRILTLYRHIIRSLKFVREKFHVPLDVHTMQRRVRMDFEKHRNMPFNRSLADAMVFRAYNDLEEMKRQHQTRPQVLKYFSQAEPIARKLQMRQSQQKTTEELRLRGSLMQAVSTTLKQKPSLIENVIDSENRSNELTQEALPWSKEFSAQQGQETDLVDFISQRRKNNQIKKQ